MAAIGQPARERAGLAARVKVSGRGNDRLAAGPAAADGDAIAAQAQAGHARISSARDMHAAIFPVRRSRPADRT